MFCKSKMKWNTLPAVLYFLESQKTTVHGQPGARGKRQHYGAKGVDLAVENWSKRSTPFAKIKNNFLPKFREKGVNLLLYNLG